LTSFYSGKILYSKKGVIAIINFISGDYLNFLNQNDFSLEKSFLKEEKKWLFSLLARF